MSGSNSLNGDGKHGPNFSRAHLKCHPSLNIIEVEAILRPGEGTDTSIQSLRFWVLTGQRFKLCLKVVSVRGVPQLLFTGTGTNVMEIKGMQITGRPRLKPNRLVGIGVVTHLYPVVVRVL